MPDALDEDDSESFFELKEETLVMSEETNQDILAYEEGMIAYRMGSSQLDSIEVGSVILSRPNTQAPGGFLEKVMGIATEGNRIILTTEPANLPDAFERYRWRFDGNDQTSLGRTDPETDFTRNDSVIAQTWTWDIPDTDWKFQLGVTFDYNLDFVSELDYNISLTSAQVDYMRVGVETFEMRGLTLDMRFIRGFSANQDTTINLPQLEQFLDNIFSIPLGYFPIDPAALVWVQPVVNLDLSRAYEFNIALGQNFTFSANTPFQAWVTKPRPEVDPMQEIVPHYQVPGGLEVSATIFAEGQLSMSAGLALGVGIAPYSRSLFTVGVRAGVGPKLGIEGFISGSLRQNSATEEPELVPQISGQATVSIEADFSAFFDASFFGLVEDELDGSYQIWQDEYPLWTIGADNSCQFYFDVVDAEAICDNGNPRVRFSVNSNTNVEVDVSGTYDIYIDNILLGIGYNPIQTYFVDLPAGIEEGMHEIRFVRSGGSSILFCDKRIGIQVFDCNPNVFCDGVASVEDPTVEQLYCIREFNGRRWFANNLNTNIGGIRPSCYNNAGENCTTFGGLYSFDDLMG
ncbi:MAG: hypothetical protein AAFU67_13845, partial [Bacteroidota bacterium]